MFLNLDISLKLVIKFTAKIWFYLYLSLLPTLVEAKERRCAIDPTDKARPCPKGCDGIVAGHVTASGL